MPPLFSRNRDEQRLLRDRVDAGARLAERLRPVLGDTPAGEIVAIGLARGGVIVAAEVARVLGVQLEAIVVRKLGAPDQPELAIGALAASGERVLNSGLIADIGIREMEIDRITARAQEAAEALCEEIGVPPAVPDVEGRTVLLIDDGLATGATMRVAVNAMRQQGAGRIIVAVPVAPAPSIRAFERIADEVVAVLTPHNLQAVGQWYERFFEVTSGEVRQALEKAREGGDAASADA